MKTPARFLILASVGIMGFFLGTWFAGSAYVSPHTSAAKRPPASISQQTQHERTADDIFGAVAPAGDEDDELARCQMLAEALEGVTASQAVPLLQRVDGMSVTARNRLLHAVFTRLCSLHPDAVRPWVLRLPRQRDPYYLHAIDDYASVFSSWVRFDAKTAVPIALEDPLAFARYFAVRTKPDDGTGEPPRIGFDTLPPGPLRERAAASYAAWGSKYVADAWSVVRTEVHGELRLAAVWALTNSAMSSYASDPAAVLDMIADFAPELPALNSGHPLVNQTAAMSIDRIEPEDVADWSLRLPEALRLSAAVAATSEWAEKSPLDALGWALKNGVPPDREIKNPVFGRWRSSLLMRALTKAPDKSIEWLASLPPGTERDRLVAYACRDSRLNEDRQTALRAALH